MPKGNPHRDIDVYKDGWHFLLARLSLSSAEGMMCIPGSNTVGPSGQCCGGGGFPTTYTSPYSGGVASGTGSVSINWKLPMRKCTLP